MCGIRALHLARQSVPTSLIGSLVHSVRDERSPPTADKTSVRITFAPSPMAQVFGDGGKPTHLLSLRVSHQLFCQPVRRLLQV